MTQQQNEYAALHAHLLTCVRQCTLLEAGATTERELLAIVDTQNHIKNAIRTAQIAESHRVTQLGEQSQEVGG